jgi:O-antigen/teichoic acid export membrane protein
MNDGKLSHLRWSYLSTLSTSVMQMAATVTITRFLQPSDYGLAAVAMMCSGVAGYFTQLGVARGIIQKHGLTTGNIRASFTLAMITGLAGFAILAALSPILAGFFRDPRLSLIIVAFGLSLVFQSMSMVPGGLLRRELRIRDLALCDFLGYLLSTFGIGLPMAAHGFGVWALVGSNVSQPLIVAIAYFIARPHTLVPTLEQENYAQIASFSLKASATTTIEALSGSLDTVMMGRVIGPSALGLYNRSYTLCFQPCYNISMGLVRVFYPVLARTAERDKKETELYLKNSQRQLMSLVIPFCAGGAAAAPTVIPFILGKQWASAIPLFQVLCLVSALDASFHLPAIHLEVISQFRYKFIMQVCFGICFGAGILLFAPKGGVLAVGLVYAALQAMRTICLHKLSAYYLEISAITLGRSIMPGLVCSLVTASSVAATQYVLCSGAALRYPILQFSALMLVGLASTTVVYRLFYKESVYKQWKSLLTS